MTINTIKIKNIFAKCCVPNRTEKFFMIKKVKNIVLWTYEIDDLIGEEIFGTFYKEDCKRQIKQSLDLKT